MPTDGLTRRTGEHVCHSFKYSSKKGPSMSATTMRHRISAGATRRTPILLAVAGEAPEATEET
jgi:hypothetical protein